MNGESTSLNKPVDEKKAESIKMFCEAIDTFYSMLKSIHGAHDAKLEAVARVAFNIENEIGLELSKDALDQISILIDSYGVSEVITASDISIRQYFNGAEESAKKCMDKLGGILYNRSRGLKFLPFKGVWF